MKKNSVGLLVSITITFLAAQLHADTFYTTVNQTAGNSPNWNSAIWTITTVTVAAAPSAGNDYVFGGFATVKVLRSPYATSTQPFNGDSLRLDPNGTLRLKSTAAPTASIYTFGTGGLKLNGGYVGNG